MIDYLFTPKTRARDGDVPRRTRAFPPLFIFAMLAHPAPTDAQKYQAQNKAHARSDYFYAQHSADALAGFC